MVIVKLMVQRSWYHMAATCMERQGAREHLRVPLWVGRCVQQDYDDQQSAVPLAWFTPAILVGGTVWLARKDTNQHIS
jgi:hypothetical protein